MDKHKTISFFDRAVFREEQQGAVAPQIAEFLERVADILNFKFFILTYKCLLISYT